MKFNMKFVYVKKFLCKCFSYTLRVIPLKNIVVFNSFNGKGMADDPKYIALELLRKRANYRLVWLLNDTKNHDIPDGIEPVKLGSYKACYFLSVAKVWIDNCRGMSGWAYKRADQYYIQTWHSTLGIKKLGTDNLKSSISARKHVKREMSKVDLMYSNSDYRVEKYRNTFWYDGAIIKCDLPRVSCIMNQPEGIKDKICKWLSIPTYCKIAMYAPTFRDNNRDEFEVYQYDFDRIRQSLEMKFGDDYVMLIRLHPHLRNSSVAKKFKFCDKVIDATMLPDMEELLCITDVLFTDFSSSMFDCSIGGKIVFLIAKDFLHYTKVNRELYFNPKTELPFDFCESEDELIDAIETFNYSTYSERCNMFYSSIGLEDHGNGDKVLADIVLSKLQ